jgi:hypothetical protein
MEMSPVIVLKIFTPSWRFSTTFLDFSKLMSSPKTEELYISQTSYIKPNLTSNIKTVKIKQRIKCFVKNLITLKISLLGCLKYFMIRCRHYPPVTTLPDLTVPQQERSHSLPKTLPIGKAKALYMPALRIILLILLLEEEPSSCLSFLITALDAETLSLLF